MKLAELSRLLRAADPAAVAVPAATLERIIQTVSDLPSLVWEVPHKESLVLDRGVLFRNAEQEELDLAPDQLLPPTVILLARPAADTLAAMPEDKAKLLFWRRLFHGCVHRDLEALWHSPARADADLRERIERLGSAEFGEIRAVLTQDYYLTPRADDLAVYIEFAAVYLELRYFARTLVPVYFPGLGDAAHVDALLARDLDAPALFARTRLEGAPEPVVLTDDQADESHDYYHRLCRAARRARAAGKTVRAAILHTRAARVAPANLTESTNREAVNDVRRLVQRLREPLLLSDPVEAQWNELLPTLLDKADQGNQPVEAALLFDLEKVCVDHERDIYTLDLVEFLLSGGKRPIKRPLPSQRVVRIAKHLRTAARKLTTARLKDAERKQLGELLEAAVHQSEDRLRERFRPIITDALHDAGLRPGNAPERTAFSKLVEELLDRIIEQGFLNFGDLRDAISRNQMKLADLADPQEYIRGDPLLRVDRRLATLLDGVYRRGENYLRWLERLTALNFGTKAGRWVTRHITLPFGGAYLLVKAGELIGAHVGGWLGFGPATPAAEQESRFAEMLLGSSAPGLAWVYYVAWLSLGAAILLLYRSAGLRSAIAQVWNGAVAVVRATFVDFPTVVYRNPTLQRALKSWPAQLGFNFVLKPAILVAPIFVFQLLPWGWWTLVLTAVASVILNSRAGQALEAALAYTVMTPYHVVSTGLIPGLIRWSMQLFKRMLDAIEAFQFNVDEWLRFRGGDSAVSLVIRTVIGAVWWPIAYVARFYLVVLIEPGFNPVKAPLSILAAKFVYPLLAVANIFYIESGVPKSPIADQLAPFIGEPLAWLLVIPALWLSPDIITFLVWETKENWRLYRSNRSALISPASVGPHGETAIALLRPGFHSGTIPRLYARLRQAERAAIGAGNWRAVRTCRQQLKEVEMAVRRFVARELAGMVNQSKTWRGATCAIGRVALSTNRLTAELTHSEFPERPAELVYENRGGWLMAGFAELGWLEELSPEPRRAVVSALASLYKLAGVDLVAEMVRANLPNRAVHFDVAAKGLLVWFDSRTAQPVLYDLREPRGVVKPRTPDGLRAAPGPALDPARVLYGQFRLSWGEWVISWQQDQDGYGHPQLMFNGQELPLLPPTATPSPATRPMMLIERPVAPPVTVNGTPAVGADGDH